MSADTGFTGDPPSPPAATGQQIALLRIDTDGVVTKNQWEDFASNGSSAHSRLTLIPSETPERFYISGRTRFADGTNDYRPAIARFDENLQPDNSIGGGDANYVELPPTADTGIDPNTDAALGPNGTVVVASLTATDVIVTRLLSNGSLDATFGGGTVYVAPDPSAGFTRVTGVAVDSNGRVAVATHTNGTPTNAVVALTANGAIDTTWSPTGIRHFAFANLPGDELTGDIAFDDHAGVVVAGRGGSSLADGEQRNAVARFTPTGDLDPTFAPNGVFRVACPVATHDAGFTGLLVDPGLLTVSGGCGSAASAARIVTTFTTPAQVTVALTADADPVNGGGGEIPVDAIDPTTVTAQQGPTDTGVAATPLKAIDLTAAPPGVQSAPLKAIPLKAIPLKAIPLTSIPLKAIPLTSIGVTPQDAGGNPVPGGWGALLSCAPQIPTPCDATYATFPVQAVNLDEALDLPQIQSLPLSSIDLSATPLKAIPLSSIALGALPLRSIPIDGNTADSPANVTAWCAVAQSVGLDCTALGLVSPPPASGEANLVSAALAGLPLKAIPLSAIPLKAIPLRSIPLSSIPLRAIPLSSIDIDATPLRAIPLTSITIDSTPLKAIPLSSIPLTSIGNIVDCAHYACATKTLGDAFADGVVLPGAILADLGGQYGGATFDDLLAATDPNAFGDTTLGDVLAGLLARADYPWQTIDLGASSIQGHSVTGGVVTYTATLDVTPSPGLPLTDVHLDIHLPPQFVYAPGSAQLDGSAFDDPAAGGGGPSSTTLSFLLHGLTGGNHTVTLRAHAALTLGAADATATATPIGGSPAGADHGIVVADLTDPGGTVATSAPLTPDTIRIGYVGHAGDTDVYSLQVPDGAFLSLSLSNLPIDADLRLYSPPAAPIRNAPTKTVPNVPDAPSSLALGESDATPQTAQDVPDIGLPIYATSAHRGTTDETIDTSPLPGGAYYVQVSGYNGAFSNQPYALRAHLTGGPPAEACTARTLTLGSPGTLPNTSSLPANLNTIFLVNQQRFAAAYPGGMSAISPSLTALAGDSADGVVGVVVPVDGDASVRAAYATWDQQNSRCSPAAANAVVSAIGHVIDSIKTARPSVTNIVIIGADDQIPMARVVDSTTVSNERGFAQELPANGAIKGALRTGYMLTDDAYADQVPLGVGQDPLFVPDVAVGRLVETPTQIASALTRFRTTHGVIQDSTGMSTGYDFLSDGAQAVAAQLAAPGRTVNTSLINDTWTRQQLIQQLLTAGSPLLDSVNAHFDPARALPADQNAAHTQNDLFTTADVRNSGANTLQGHLLFSMGCHAGLDIPDVDAQPSAPVDTWTKTFADQGALWVGNSTYGYGDTDTVALSELLMTDFAHNLDGSLNIGGAFAYAKQSYAGALGVVGPYDRKVLMAATFYGLPMYRLATHTNRPAPPTPLPTATDPLTLRTTATVTLNLPKGNQPGQQKLEHGTHGDYYDIDGRTQKTQQRPIEPLTTVDVTQPASGPSGPNLTLGKIAHGALLTGLTSTDEAITPLSFQPVLNDGDEHSSDNTTGSVFPTVLQTVNDETSPDGQRQRFVFISGQFTPDPAHPGAGTQRLFTQANALVYYADPSEQGAAHDFDPPVFDTSGATANGANIAFTADVHDAQGQVRRVLVLFAPIPAPADAGAPRVWTALDLVKDPNSNRWTGGAPANAPNGVEYIIQAVDDSGNVGVTSNKGDGFRGQSSSASGAIPVTLAGHPSAAPGIFLGDQPVTATAGGPTTGFVYFLDGQGPNAYTGPVPVTGDGVHTVHVVAPDQRTGDAVAVIDGTGPTTTASVPPPLASGWYHDPVTVQLHAFDAGSGVQSISSTKDGFATTTTTAGNTAGVTVAQGGSTTVTAHATDVAGNVGANTSATVKVDLAAPIVPCASPPSGWSSSDVTIHCTASDTDSGLANPSQAAFDLKTSVPAGTTNPTASTPSATVCDKVNRCTTVGPFTAKVDKTPPTVTCTSPTANWSKTDVTASCTASDAGVGLANPAQASFTRSTSVPDGTANASAPIPAATVCDALNQCRTVGPWTAKVDKAPPTAIIATPLDGDVYFLNQSVAAAYLCADVGSGIAANKCVGTKANGSNIDTSSAGTKTFTVTATDVAGNQTVTTSTYTVQPSNAQYSICRIAPTVTRTGQTALFIVYVCDKQGHNVTKSSLPVTAVSIDRTRPINPSAAFKFLSILGINWEQYGLDTTALAIGRHTLQIKVGTDPVLKDVGFWITR
ncbi:MAG TPA: hypothetical protein VGJ03_08960 [Acidimicrobiales bacterium]